MKPIAISAALGLCFLSSATAVEIEAPLEPAAEPQIQIEVFEGHPELKPKTEAIPKMYAGDKAIALKMEALVRDVNGHYNVKFRIINPTDKPMKFTGYSEASPITKTQHWTDGKWVDEQRFLRCGTGLRQCTIAPGQSAVFQTHLQGDKLPARIGIGYNSEGKAQLTVWSEKVER